MHLTTPLNKLFSKHPFFPHFEWNNTLIMGVVVLPSGGSVVVVDWIVVIGKVVDTPVDVSVVVEGYFTFDMVSVHNWQIYSI